jgi:hypothetical protein
MKHTEIVAVDTKALFEGVGELEPREKQILEREAKALRSDMVTFAQSKLAIGEHLAKIHEILEPKRVFGRFLDNLRSGLSKRTALRYIDGFHNAAAMLPEPVLREAMARGMNILGHTEDRPLGRYTLAVKRLPAPKSNNPKVIDAYLEEVAEKTRELYSNELERDEDELVKEVFRFFDARFQRLPNSHKTRRRFVETLGGMMVARLGVSTPQTFEPVAIDTVRAVRGRPRHKEPEAA